MFGIARLINEWSCCAHSNRNIASFGGVKDLKSIDNNLLEIGIAINAGDAKKIDLWMACGEEQGEGVIYSGIDVENEIFHDVLAGTDSYPRSEKVLRRTGVPASSSAGKRLNSSGSETLISSLANGAPMQK